MIDLTNDIIKKINEETTQANIAYLPGGFSKVGSAIKTLLRLKKSWDIEVLEGEESKTLQFSDDLQVVVDNKDWDTFLIDMSDSGLSKVATALQSKPVTEVRDEVVTEGLLADIEKQLRKLVQVSPIRDIRNVLDMWKTNFGVSKYQNTDSFAINYGKEDADIRNLLTLIWDRYKDDRGALELILTNLEKELPLNTFDVFRDFDYLYGADVLSNPEKINMRAQFVVDPGFTQEQLVYTKDRDLLEQLADDKSLKVNPRTGLVSSRSGIFTDKIFKNIKDILREI